MKFSEKTWYWFIKKTGLVNNTLWNSFHWKKYLKEEQGKSSGFIGYVWGNPESAQDYYGNYKQILDWLQVSISSDSHVIEIGSFGGKWTQYMGRARLVTCVDLFEEAFDFLEKRLGDRLNIQFYKTKGNELRGLTDNSADLVFSMDTFVRVPKGSIEKYFFEIFRVLKKEGKILIHLPCKDIAFCRHKAFTAISGQWIRKTMEEAGFKMPQFHFDLIKHGIIVQAIK